MLLIILLWFLFGFIQGMPFVRGLVITTISHTLGQIDTGDDEIISDVVCAFVLQIVQ